MPRMRWMPPGPNSVRTIFGYVFAPPAWEAEVAAEDVEELLTYPGEQYALTPDPSPEGRGEEETPEREAPRRTRKEKSAPDAPIVVADEAMTVTATSDTETWSATTETVVDPEPGQFSWNEDGG